VDNSSDWLVIGRFGRPNGLKGYVSVISFAEPQEAIIDYKQWYIFINEHWQPLKLIDVELRPKLVLVQVENYQTRENAARLTNLDIGIKREELPVLASGEFYWHQLEGMQVETTTGLILGTILEILSTGSNDVLVVSGEKRYLIPYLPGQYVLEVMEKERRIIVDWDVDF